MRSTVIVPATGMLAVVIGLMAGCQSAPTESVGVRQVQEAPTPMDPMDPRRVFGIAELETIESQSKMVRGYW